MDYITLYLKSTEYDFLRKLSDLIQTPENAHGISCITNLPDAAFVCIRHEHACFGLSVKDIQGRIAFHVLAIWYVLAKGVKDKASLIEEMFYDLELDEESADIFDKFPWVTSETDETVMYQWVLKFWAWDTNQSQALLQAKAPILPPTN